MNKLKSILVALVLALMFVACGDEAQKDNFLYTIECDALNAGLNSFAVTEYVKEKVTTGEDSQFGFFGEIASSDELATNVFNGCFGKINEVEFCAMMMKGEYFDFKLVRKATSRFPGKVVATKRYKGTK